MKNARTIVVILCAAAAAGVALGWQWPGQRPAPPAPLASPAGDAPVPTQAAMVPQPVRADSGPVQDIEWFALVPAGWEPIKTFNDSIARLEDSDPRAMAALEELRAAWADAPVEPSMDGAHVRIGGYLIPLDGEGEDVREFLLVPYFGACIHAPPPPANQVIHVTLAQPLKEVGMMDAVHVSGTLRVARDRTPENTAGLLDAVGYEMHAHTVAPYKPE